MKILFRYVLREFCIPLSLCITGFLSIYLLFELLGSFGRLMEAKPGFGNALSYLAGYLAPWFMWVAPASLMLATLYTMWNFCRHSELTAMRASGVGFTTIVKPLLLVAVLMACVVAWINEVYVPRRGLWAEKFKANAFKQERMQVAEDFDRKMTYNNPRNGRKWSITRVMNAKATELEGVLIKEYYPGANPRSVGNLKRTLKAGYAQYADGEWMLDDLTVTHYADKTSHDVVPSPTPELDRLPRRSFGDLLEERPEDILRANRRRDWKYASARELWNFIRTNRDSLDPVKLQDCVYDLWSKLVAPLACIVITLFAIPAGIASGRQSVFKGILGALGMFFAFYGLTIFCMVCTKDGGWMSPILAALLPDIVFFVVGCHLFRKQR